jgi:hypothetical protein
LIYEGDFNQGAREGKGQLLKEEVFELKGDFFSERPNGICKVMLTNGDEFRGKFVYGVRYGFGTLAYGRGDKQETGFWNQNILKEKVYPDQHVCRDEDDD